MTRPVPTLADVARAAQVSTATVSRCLNSPDVVNAETRQKVMAAVNALGYAPNFNARALAARRSNTVGAVIPTMENAIFARSLQAFQETLNEDGVTLLVASSQYEPALEAEQVRNLIARGVDGIFLIGYQRSQEIYDMLESRGIHYVVGWAYNPADTRAAVGFDNFTTMYNLAELVIEEGHTSLGMISAETSQNDRARDRVVGVRAAVKSAGLPDDALTVIETTYAIPAGAEAMQILMEADKPPTAVLCGNDVIAVGAIKGAKAMGLRVPEDVSVTGFDDMEIATVIEPALTTIHVPHRAMGREAARILVEMMNGATERRSCKLETTLQMRDTLAPPRA